MNRSIELSMTVVPPLPPGKLYLIQNSLAVRKECGPQKGYDDKIQGGGQEMAVMVG